MANKRYCESGMNQGIGKGKSPAKPTSGTVQSAPMPEKTASWPGLPGKAQPRSRAAGTPTSGKLGPFYVKNEGI